VPHLRTSRQAGCADTVLRLCCWCAGMRGLANDRMPSSKRTISGPAVRARSSAAWGAPARGQASCDAGAARPGPRRRARARRLVMPMSRMLLSASTPSILVSSWLTTVSCTPLPSRTLPRDLQIASISSKMMTCSSLAAPLAFSSASASCAAAGSRRDRNRVGIVGSVCYSGSAPQLLWTTALASCTQPARRPSRVKEVLRGARMRLCRAPRFAAQSCKLGALRAGAGRTTNSLRMFSSEAPTYLLSTSGPLTTLGSRPFSILPICRAISVLPARARAPAGVNHLGLAPVQHLADLPRDQRLACARARPGRSQPAAAAHARAASPGSACSIARLSTCKFQAVPLGDERETATATPL
jgi:hypothetical protein